MLESDLPLIGDDVTVEQLLAHRSGVWAALFAGRIVLMDWVAEMVRPRSAVPWESLRYGLGF
ncbi:MAG: hypothetical protein ACRDJB_09905 [Actinomycetota bacterium]